MNFDKILYTFNYSYFLFAIMFAEILLFVVLFASKLKKKKFFVLRFSLSLIVILFLIAALTFINSFIVQTNEVKGNLEYVFGSRFVITTLIWLLCCGLVELCYETTSLISLFVAVASANGRNIAYCLFSIILSSFKISIEIFPQDFLDYPVIISFVATFSVTWVVLYFFFQKKLGELIQKYEDKIILILFALSIITNYFGLNATIIYIQRDLFVFIALLLVFTSISVIAFVVQHVQLQKIELAFEKHEAEMFLAKEEKMYHFQKNVVDMLNVKAHDIKHLIHDIENTGKLDKETIEELTTTTDLYESMAKTDNEPLNVILTEKWIYCKKHKIAFTPVIDPNSLLFMKANEVYSLIGNILDNAIEASLKCPVENRAISLSITTKKGMQIVEASNNYVGKVVIKGGIPKTTKEDKENHGFGIKSIKVIANKYDGAYDFSTSNNVFTTRIIFTNIAENIEK